MNLKIISLFFLINLFTLSPAFASRILVTGFEQDGTVPSTKFWSTVSGTIDVEAAATTSTNGNADNDWSIEIDPTSGNSEYLVANYSASAEGIVHFYLKINSIPSTARNIVSFSDGSGNRQCFAQLGSDARIRLYHKDTAKECAQSQSNNGRACTYTQVCVGGAADGACCSDAEECNGTPNACSGGTCTVICDELNEGEASCTDATFAKSATLLGVCSGGSENGNDCFDGLDCPSGTCVGTWYEIAITQDLSQTLPGDVACGLWIDGRNRGSRVRPQGACSGGSEAGNSCSQNSDCSGGGTCSVTTVFNSTRLILGADDTVSTSTILDMNLDDIAFDTTVDTSLISLRIHDIHPDGMGGAFTWGVTGCTGTTAEHECVDDTIGTAAQDGTSTRLDGALNDEDRFTMDGITLGAGESVAGVSVSCSAREQGALTEVNKELTIALFNSAESSSVASSEIVIDDYGDTDFYITPFRNFTTKPGGGAWGESDVNGAVMSIKNTGTSGTSFKIHVTDCAAHTEITKPLPVLPDELDDLNSDGDITWCFIGDSRFDQEPFEQAVVSRLDQPDNILACAVGGKRIGQVVDSLDNILDGVTTGSYACAEIRGVSAHCDYAVLDIGINDFGGHPNFPAEGVCYQSVCAGGVNVGDGCRTDSDCPSSTCGGPNHGDPCLMPDGYFARDTATTTYYCAYGADFVAETLHAPPTPCTGANQCTGDPATGSPASCDPLGSTIRSWCLPGIVDSPNCPSGLCLHKNDPTYWEREMRTILDTAAARTGGDTVKIIMAATYDTRELGVPSSGIMCFFGDTRPDTRWMRAAQIRLAQEYGLNYFDMGSEFRDKAAPGSPDCLLKNSIDNVHPSEAPRANCNGHYGGDVIAGLMEACAEQTPSPNVFCSDLP